MVFPDLVHTASRKQHRVRGCCYGGGSQAQLPSLFGDIPNNAYEQLEWPYEIANGKINTFISNTPIGISVYKVAGSQAGVMQRDHDTYYGARSNEFGYANYEILLNELSKEIMSIPAADQSKYLHKEILRK